MLTEADTVTGYCEHLAGLAEGEEYCFYQSSRHKAYSSVYNIDNVNLKAKEDNSGN